MVVQGAELLLHGLRLRAITVALTLSNIIKKIITNHYDALG